MLRNKIAFVVGAGASAEFGLPVGSELARRISEKLNVIFNDRGNEIVSGDRDLFNNVARSEGPNPNHAEWQKAAWLIRDGIVLAHSIDDFLDAHQHDARVVAYGKAAIASCILDAERQSTLYFDPHARQLIRGRPPTIDMNECADSWLAGLMRLLVRGLSHADRAKIFDQCSFIVFNYDRCVEHFFLHALQRFYNISAGEAAEIVRRMRIYHPYGVAGQLASVWHAAQTATFGAERADCHAIGGAVLKTYTETVDAAEIREAVGDAEKLVFLGFAFHDQNMEVLAKPRSMKLKKTIGTAYNMSEADRRIVTSQIGRWAEIDGPSMRNQVSLHDKLKAADIFNFYSKSL
ncbi:MAG: hypothetical protein AB7I42_07030 [Bradyrhizobium sp.]|uniref:hypothetical protein n=1 Tax=Bradyrhizobium sp. TaxID=376 RepID=UPI003D13B5CF